MKVKGLAELAQLRDEMRRLQAEAVARRAQAAAEAARRERERAWFSHAVGPVQPLKPAGHAHIQRQRPDPEPRQRQADERAALQEALSDEVDVESLLLTDDGLSYRRPDVPADVVSRLRRGQWSIQGELDLHGKRRDEARDALASFIKAAHQASRRCLRVVHGKGHGSPGREPVLKAKVQRWLAQREEVIAFTQAAGPQGGAGAVIVLLAGRPHRRGRATQSKLATLPKPEDRATAQTAPPEAVDTRLATHAEWVRALQSLKS